MLFIFPNDRKRFAPITLPGKQPIAQFVIHFAPAMAVFLEPANHFRFRFPSRQPVDDRRIYRDAVADKSGGQFVAGWLDYIDNFQPELARELEIARIMRRHAHDRAGAVTEYNIIGGPDRNPLLSPM